MAGGKDWRHRSAPTLVEFEELADLAWRRLPAEFRAMCGDVLIRIEDFPTEEVLDELKLESPFDLMGLYHGVSLDKKSVSDLPRVPDMVFLYRRPLLDVWAEGDGDPGPPRHARPGARDRPPFRLVRQGHGRHRGGRDRRKRDVRSHPR